MIDASSEPLILNAERDDKGPENDEIDQNSTSLLLEKNLRRPGLYMCLLALSAGISGLLFGYDTGVISSTLVGIRSSLGHPLTTFDKSLITSMTSFSALIISPVSGLLADTYGRKTVILAADLAFFIGAIIQAFAASVGIMIIGRSVIGLAIGAGSFVAPLYITELSPSPFRGSLVIVSILFVTFGQMIAYVIGWLFVEVNNTATGWRWIVGLGAVPAILQSIIMLGMPDTPRWLVMKNRSSEARTVMINVFGPGTEISCLVDLILEDIEAEVNELENAKKSSIGREVISNRAYWLARLKHTSSELFCVDANRKALMIACVLQGFQELCGFNSLMYFSATIFTLLGFDSPAFTSLSVACTNFVFTCVSLLLVDRVGRRRTLLYSIPFMASGLLFCSVGFSYIPDLVSLSDLKVNVMSNNTMSSSFKPDIAALVVLISIVIFVGSYAVGMGTIPWLQSELFSLHVRALGSSLSTSTNWATNFLVGLTFLPMIETLTPSGTFIFYSGICMLGWVAIWRLYPERMGYGLEKMKDLDFES
ncbi:Myo-inositol transporter 2 [Erysiphe neolycopersici]|uniref:Myo-inositol transporter 2 n=1 Tax=Erysiphe neolycopersici TaxID=212602 RepID=A0A420HWF9_9PEZI|nr:Myo-inositol transporter 2 [Erysiphe neolycopersici]